MTPDYTARINSTSGRATVWQKVFQSEPVPLKSPLSIRADLPGIGPASVYEMDIAALTAEQRARLVAHIAETFGIAAVDVEADLDKIGCPILADDVTVTILKPWKILP